MAVAEFSETGVAAFVPEVAYAPTPAAAPDAPWFRVTAEWEGGGFEYTLRFNDAQTARQWATARVAHRHGATVQVEQRSAEDCAELTEREVESIAADLHIAAMKDGGEWVRRRDERAYIDNPLANLRERGFQ